MADDQKGLSRRDFLKTTGIATGALVGGGLIGGLVGYNVNKGGGVQTKSGTQNAKNTDVTSVKGLMFFTNHADFNVLSQAVERIFPEDDLGPGAIGLGVPYFIDNQLAGNYGSNAREYMQGPFFAGEATQGYQSRLTRAEMFRQGIAKMEEEAQKRYKKSFVDLDGGQMDEILTSFQKNEVDMKGVSSEFFFRVLRQATLEGAYADPIYNGNNNMDAWRMKGFPGHQMAYINLIEEEKFQKIEPKSISTMQH
ncbi:gluconate 2-dehydrogenase subunit 3 family protein [Sporosarcina highlanderae]|uniref:Gluconate 2-dehydrogenase subunit 3 family protein n=1 Tax=Sporosarcina highlanderae TaxID=3035916 RepID=A0ABT8JMA5_9BACL|nr:gluconate 2-dehydrogenase subunit 3 family protein [Sporosarcina highlanderae]MDN4606276.1 gluconate 2-dehydrogenase subunit 3 family protein [Sporosarcina highlanderae]